MKHYSHKLCRRYGVKLCQSQRCPVVTRKSPPGMHGQKGYRRQTEFGTQMAEKQKAKITYNILERQFKNYYQEAISRRGDTVEFLLQILELRLDNVIYRGGLAKTRPQARQLVNHGFFQVNGKLVDIPSYRVKIKDKITIKPQKAAAKLFNDLPKQLEKHVWPSWLFYDSVDKSLKVLALPKTEEAEQTFNPKMIVEFYSK